MLLAGCSKDADISNSTTLSGNGEKTPLLINATLDTGKGLTRAAGKDFAEGDQLKVYIRHITGGSSVGNYTYIDPVPDPDYANQLVTITKGSTDMTVVNESVNSTTDLSPVYWDDFSNSSSGDTNLRTSGHGLQSYYGYCYNGQTFADPTGDNLANGVITWTVQANQSTAAAVQHSDLLWSPELTKVTYDHVNNPDFPIRFTHAMCQITVELTANSSAGFSGDPLTSTTLDLHNMHTQTTLTAPTSEWVDVPGDANANITDIAMYGGTTTTGLTRAYTAIVAPGTKLKKGEKLLDVTNADGNDYEVIITDAMLDNTDGWGKYHTDGGKYGEDGGNKYIVTQPGVNYHLELRIDKSAVQVSASLENWSTVEAAGTGAIKFTDDVVGVSSTSGFADGSAFSLFWRKANTSDPYSCVTTSTYDNEDPPAKWTNDPIIYWPNKTDNYYFRALANVTSAIDANPITITARPIDANTFTDITSGYILWGTTAAHSSYALGAAIPPRTGGVPLEFRVVNKCKVSFALETAVSGGAQVTLDGASISINNIYNTGTINLEDGTVTGSAITTLAGTYSIAEQEVLAQIINENAVVTVTLADNAGVYKINLNQCVESGGTTPITVWKGGHTYNYTIHVEKEDVKFSAVVKPWTTVSGSGTASLNWE